MIDSNGIGTELLHDLGVELTLVCVDERVLVDELVGDTYSHAVSKRFGKQHTSTQHRSYL